MLTQKNADPKLTEDDIDWQGARLLCIEGEFTKFDEHAVKQIDRNIELIRYRRYGNESSAGIGERINREPRMSRPPAIRNLVAKTRMPL